MTRAADDFGLATGRLFSFRPLLPSNPSFAGHQTFALRSGWLKKGLDALDCPLRHLGLIQPAFSGIDPWGAPWFGRLPAGVEPPGEVVHHGSV